MSDLSEMLKDPAARRTEPGSDTSNLVLFFGGLIAALAMESGMPASVMASALVILAEVGVDDRKGADAVNFMAKLARANIEYNAISGCAGERLMANNPYMGSSFEDFLKEEGILEEVDEVAVGRVIAWQMQQEANAARLRRSLADANAGKLIEREI